MIAASAWMSLVLAAPGQDPEREMIALLANQIASMSTEESVVERVRIALKTARRAAEAGADAKRVAALVPPQGLGLDRGESRKKLRRLIKEARRTSEAVTDELGGSEAILERIQAIRSAAEEALATVED